MKRFIALVLGLVASAFCVFAQAQTLTPVLTTDLNEPYGVAVDRTNNYYITDSGNNRIIRFSPETGARTNLAGGRSGFADGPGYLAQFSSPQGIVAARGGFVVADSGNNRIRFIAADGYVTTLAGGAVGFADGVGASALFNNPSGLAADLAGNIYVADMNNNAVRKLDVANRVTTVASGSTVFRRPAALALGDDGVIYVGDSGNNSIRAIATDGTVRLFAGSGSGTIAGSNDAIVATDARFSNPQGLLWIGDRTLLVSDTENQILRRIYFNASITNYSVATLTNTVGAGLLSPVGLAKDQNGDYLVVDLRGKALRRISVTESQIPVRDPSIGTVVLAPNPTGGSSAALTPVTSSVFNNDVVIAILAEPGTETFYTLDGTEPTTTHGTTPPPYEDGQPNLPNSLIDLSQAGAPSDITIKAFSTSTGRRASSTVTARFRFQVANPALIGNNASFVNIECATIGALIHYTTDGTDPTQSSPLYVLGSALNIVHGTNDVLLKARAYKNGYEASRIVSGLFLYEKIQISTVGMTRDFVGGIGSTIVVPVEVQLTNSGLKSLQFRVEVTPLSGGAPSISDQMRVVGINPDIDYLPIPRPVTDTNITLPYFGVYANGPATGLAVGFFATNYTLDVKGEMTVAMLAIPIPKNAVEGQTYKLALLYPSGTSDGFEAPVPLNSLPDRTITVSNVAYIVGDSALSDFYNAGDFGNGNLNNNDVNHAFYASLGVQRPYAFSDVFDAMDAYPEDTPGVVGGDGDIRFLDWYTIFERSLRLLPTNFTRKWAPGGFRVPGQTNLNLLPALPATQVAVDSSGSAWHVEGTLSATHLGNINPGDTVSVPVSLAMTPDHSLSGLQFRAAVLPSVGAPFVSGLNFRPAPGKPAPGLFGTLAGNALCGWPLDSFSPELAGDENLLGYLTFTVPPDAKANQYYTIRFYFAGGGTRQDGQKVECRLESLAGSVWVQSPVQKVPDVISDEWRTYFFGKLDSVFADAFADPDGDGRSNLQEFLAGTNPAKLRFYMLNTAWQSKLAAFKLKWFAKTGKQYVIECATDSVNGPWQPVSELLDGKGDLLDFDAPKSGLGSMFYRVREK